MHLKRFWLWTVHLNKRGSYKLTAFLHTNARKCELNSQEKKRKMLKEEVKCAISDTLVAESTQHLVRKYALAIILFSCIHIGLDWDEQNHHLLKNQCFELLPYFHGAFHFGMLPRMEPSSDAQWSSNLTYVLSFWNSPSCFYKILRKHKLSFVLCSCRPTIRKNCVINIRTPVRYCIESENQH
jgi:hypothetical protein